MTRKRESYSDLGTTIIEYVGLVTFVAAIMTVFFTTDLGASIGGDLDHSVCRILGDEDCGDDPSSGQPQALRQPGLPGHDRDGNGYPDWCEPGTSMNNHPACGREIMDGSTGLPGGPSGPTAEEIEEFKEEVLDGHRIDYWEKYSDAELRRLVTNPEVATWLLDQRILPVVESFRNPCTGPNGIGVVPCAEGERTGYDYREIFTNWLNSEVVPAVVISTAALDFWAAGAIPTLSEDWWSYEVDNDITVLGKYPQYLEMGEELNAETFNIPTELWDELTTSEQWALNRDFIDHAVSRGSDIRLSDSALDPDNLTGAFGREIEYLQDEHGYTISDDGYRMLPPED